MKRARMIVLAIAFAAAGGAAYVAKNMTGIPKIRTVEINTADTVKVLVASRNIRLGDSVRSKDLKWQDWPKQAAVSGYIIKSRQPKAESSFSGAIARAPFLEGEPIKEQKLIKVSEGGVMAAILPSGMRAISTPIREETSAGGFILPNDRVDVIVSRRVQTADTTVRQRGVRCAVWPPRRLSALRSSRPAACRSTCPTPSRPLRSPG